MSILEQLFWRKKAVQESPKAPNVKVNKNSYKDFLVKAVGFIAKQGANRGDFEEPEFNLNEIRVAYKSDSYIKMAHMKYAYLLFKASYELKGSNEEAIEYLKSRFRLMGFSTQKPMDILFQEIGDDVLLYSNAFLAKSRVKKPITGIKAVGVLNDQPIGGYYRLDPTSVTIKRDKNGTVLKYKQTNNSGEEKEFLPTEVIHIYIDKDGSSAYGTPRILAALEDVKLLRRIEGNIIALIYRFAIPLYQWIIGKAEKGFEATDPEIADAKREIENMTLEGCIVTNEKTEIKAIGVEGEALDASAYLTYFEKRVFSALGVSETQMGRGSAKQNADSMDEQAHDIIKYVQRVMGIFIKEFMLNELLLEGGYNPLFNKEDIIDFTFNEISVDTKIKVENAEIYKFQSDVITFDEVRHNLGLDADDVDESKLFTNMVTTKAALDQISAQGDNAIELARVSAAVAPKPSGTSSSSSSAKSNGNGKTKSAKPNGAVKSVQRPQNQYGTTTAKAKESFSLDESLKKSELKSKKSFANIYNNYEMICNDIIETNSDKEIIFALGRDRLLKAINHELLIYSLDGTADAKGEAESILDEPKLFPRKVVSLTLFEDMTKDTVENLLKDIKKKIGKSSDEVQIRTVFNTMEYRLKFLINYVFPKVYWYSFIKTGQAYGIEKAYIDFDGSDDSKDHSDEIDTSNFSLDDIPAFHAFCDCKVSFRK